MGSRPWKKPLQRRLLRAQGSGGGLVLTVSRGCDCWRGQIEVGDGPQGPTVIVGGVAVTLDRTVRIEGVPAPEWPRASAEGAQDA